MEAIEMIAGKLYPKPKGFAGKEFAIYEGLRNTMDIVSRFFESNGMQGSPNKITKTT